MVIQRIACILYYVPLENISLIWRRHEGSRKNLKGNWTGKGNTFCIYSKIPYKFALKNDTFIKTNIILLFKNNRCYSTLEIKIKHVFFLNCQITLQFVFIVV